MHLENESQPVLGTEVERNTKLDKVLISGSCLQEATAGVSQSIQ